MNLITEKQSDSFLPASGVWRRYGVTSMTLHRWLADEGLSFPRPFYLGRFRFWRIAELEAWEAKQPRASIKHRYSSDCCARLAASGGDIFENSETSGQSKATA